uniref:Protein E7 n=1 Tax=Bovine papillomavirus TaxID=10571 RepID=A3QME7_9PAPI|nr:E7 [Bovine papillomavirus]
MKGQNVTLQDVTLQFEHVISPVSLNCEEEELEVEEVDCPNPYAIETACYVCEDKLRIAVVTSNDGIRDLQELLLNSLFLLCASCSREAFCLRRAQQNG